jgi:hypothetical protein
MIATGTEGELGGRRLTALLRGDQRCRPSGAIASDDAGNQAARASFLIKVKSKLATDGSIEPCHPPAGEGQQPWSAKWLAKREIRGQKPDRPSV